MTPPLSYAARLRSDFIFPTLSLIFFLRRTVFPVKLCGPTDGPPLSLVFTCIHFWCFFFFFGL